MTQAKVRAENQDAEGQPCFGASLSPRSPRSPAVVATKHCGVPSSLNLPDFSPKAFLEQKTRVEGSVAKFVPEDSQRTPL